MIDPELITGAHKESSSFTLASPSDHHYSLSMGWDGRRRGVTRKERMTAAANSIKIFTLVPMKWVERVEDDGTRDFDYRPIVPLIRGGGRGPSWWGWRLQAIQFQLFCQRTKLNGNMFGMLVHLLLGCCCCC